MAYNDPEMRDFMVVNYFLDCYLNEAIPKAYEESAMNDEMCQQIETFLRLQDKAKGIKIITNKN